MPRMMSMLVQLAKIHPEAVRPDEGYGGVRVDRAALAKATQLGLFGGQTVQKLVQVRPHIRDGHPVVQHTRLVESHQAPTVDLTPHFQAPRPSPRPKVVSDTWDRVSAGDIARVSGMIRAGFGFTLRGWSLNEENGRLLIRDRYGIYDPTEATSIAAAISFMAREKIVVPKWMHVDDADEELGDAISMAKAIVDVASLAPEHGTATVPAAGHWTFGEATATWTEPVNGSGWGVVRLDHPASPLPLWIAAKDAVSAHAMAEAAANALSSGKPPKRGVFRAPGRLPAQFARP